MQQFYTENLNNWCKYVTEEVIVSTLLANNWETSGAKRKRGLYQKYDQAKISKQIVVNQNGNFKINKSILDVFVIYWPNYACQKQQATSLETE